MCLLSLLEDKFLAEIMKAELPIPEREYRFHHERRWRFDFYWPQSRLNYHQIACECEGGTYSGGRHVRGIGFEKDCEKYNEAALMGILILRVTGKHVTDGRAIEWLRRALDGRGIPLGIRGDKVGGTES